jgi:DUF1680 family protein
MRRFVCKIGFCFLLLPLTSSAAGLPEARGKRLVEPFDYHGVTLEAGPLKDQVDEVKRYYLAILDDDLLKGFRARAGHPAPGNELGGWYSADTFLVFGQIVSGLARLYAGTGDTACRDKANRLVAEWAKCIEPGGYFYASRKPNAPHYIYDKMVWGLLDCYLYCGNQDALQHLQRITAWATTNLGHSRQVNETATEWYTLSENLYRAYLATGDVMYRDFARVWEYHDYWDIYARGGDIFAPRPDGARTEAYHAYSHVNTLGGAAMAYLVKGERQYLQTVLNAGDYLLREQCFATGGFGPDEQLLPRNKLLEKLRETHNTFETQCGSWAVFKLAKYLISFSGDARYGDWIERLVLNGVGITIPMTSDGRVLYYSDYCLDGGAKRNIDFGWSCCTGTRPQAIADYHDLIYFHDAHNLYVNLFTPSTVHWLCSGGNVTLSQRTQFPESSEVNFALTLSKPAEFGIRFRVPGWLAEPPQAMVNGQPARLKTDAMHWATIRRRWKNGDKISLTLPMKLWSSSLNPPGTAPAAALFGPVVLAFEAPSGRTLSQLDLSAPERSLKPVSGRPLTFSASSNSAIRAKPLFEFHAGERYFVYLDPAMGKRIPYMEVKFTGNWQESGAFRFSNEPGAAAECEFDGTGIRWLGRRFNDAGVAEITIDGAVVGVVDQYGPGRDLPFDWSHAGLPRGHHSIRLRLLQDKPEKSIDRFLNIAGFEVLEDP